MEVTIGFKGLDLTDRVPEELWMKDCDNPQEAEIKSIPKNKKISSNEVDETGAYYTE